MAGAAPGAWILKLDMEVGLQRLSSMFVFFVEEKLPQSQTVKRFLYGERKQSQPSSMGPRAWNGAWHLELGLRS